MFPLDLLGIYFSEMSELVNYLPHVILCCFVTWFLFIYRKSMEKTCLKIRTFFVFFATLIGFTNFLLSIKLFATSVMFPGVLFILPDIPLAMFLCFAIPSTLLSYLSLGLASWIPFPLGVILLFFGIVLAAEYHVIVAYFLLLGSFRLIAWMIKELTVLGIPNPFRQHRNLESTKKQL